MVHYSRPSGVALALFDFRVNVESKKLMIAAMAKTAPDDLSKHPVVPSPAFHEVTGLGQISQLTLRTYLIYLQFHKHFSQKNQTCVLKMMGQ